MQTPAFVDGQFVDGSLLNGAVAQIMSDFELIGTELHTPGVLNPSQLAFTAPSAMLVNVSAPVPFGVLFGNGLVMTANGVISGAVTSTYQVNFAPLVPTSGSPVTAYVVASYLGFIGQQQIQVVGPPVGHPDYDPTFAPFQFYLENLDALNIGVTTSAPDNVNTFELARTSLTVGQTTINASQVVSGAFWHYASAVLNPTGVAPGTYAGATIIVAADGRISAVSGVAYGPLAGNNTWTGNNTFSQPVTAFDPNSNASAGLVISGSAAGATVMLKGTGSGSTPNKWLRALNGAFNILNNAYGVILTLTDVGTLTVPAGIVAGTTLTAGGSISAATTVHAGTLLTAATGAKNSGNSQAATILADYDFAFTSQNLFAETIPDNFSIQMTGSVIPAGGGNQTTVLTLPRSFHTDICGALVCFAGNTPPQGVVLSCQPFSPNQVAVTTDSVLTGTVGVVVVAFGF